MKTRTTLALLLLVALISGAACPTTSPYAAGIAGTVIVSALVYGVAIWAYDFFAD